MKQCMEMCIRDRYGCCDRRKYVLHGFKEAGRIRLVDADAGADIGSLCADVPAGLSRIHIFKPDIY